MKIFPFFLLTFAFCLPLWAAQAPISVPEGVITKVTLPVGRVETLPLNVGIRKGYASIKLGRTDFATNPSSVVVLQMWSFINSQWVQMCVDKTTGQKLVSTDTTSLTCETTQVVNGKVARGTQAKVMFLTTVSALSTSLLFEIK